MATKTLVLISIGPVQEFIASARKLRDLWFGSNLLSELSKTVARTLQAHKARLVFPSPASADDLLAGSDFSCANKILAEYDGDEPAELIESARQAWRKDLAEAAKKAKDVMGEKFARLGLRSTMFDRQIDDSGEFYGVWQVIGPDGYGPARAALETLLAARKGLRSFAAPSWDGCGIPKNSLDGLRESVIEAEAEIPGLLKKSERLDAMGCIKRFSPLADRRSIRHFDDLASCALVPWLAALKNAGHEQDETAFIAALGGKAGQQQRYDEAWYDDLEVLRREYGDGATEANAIRKRIIKTLGPPPLYACILVGDGDHMGGALDAITSAEGHRVFSRGLAGFAAAVGDVIASYGGALIYAGGDDVMAYVPVDTAFECAAAVRASFAHTIEQIFSEAEIKKELGSITRPTLSAGLAMVHHQMPLGAALGLARHAERLAKNEGGRDALAFVMSKRSGCDIAIYGKWDDTQSGKGMLSRIIDLCQLYQDKDFQLSHALGYQLREAARLCGDRFEIESSGDGMVAKNAAAAMILDIFKQKKDSTKLARLLPGRTSIRKLSDDLVIARQIHVVQSIGRGGVS